MAPISRAYIEVFRCFHATSIFPQIYRAKLIQIARRSRGRIPMRLCIINYGTRCAGHGSFTRENARPLPFVPRILSSLGKIQTIFHDREQCRSRDTVARQIRTITSHLRCHVKCANVANRHESVRKLVELQPLPVIKSKERRRYVQYNRQLWWDYRKKGKCITCTTFVHGI